MAQSQFDAKTFGLGELISQRKLFRVPRHQRSYAWSKNAIETFLFDVETAFLEGAHQYFVGLIVLQGPEEGEWTLLDGQQRLTTTSMIFAAIRDWLKKNKFEEDAKQIETEYLAVRRLGGNYSSRMLLNAENEECFNELVIDSSPNKRANFKYPAKTSNRLLSECYFICQKWLETLIKDYADKNEKAYCLFKLSSYLENRLKTVCVEVSSEVEAYILFESLNDRGVELSALDLVKNYIFSKIELGNIDTWDLYWQDLLSNLEGANPDDFLKVFWTSRYGIIQKDQIFKKIRDTYTKESEVQDLLKDLVADSLVLSAFEEPEHPIWSQYPRKTRDYLHTLKILSAKQTRSVLLAAYNLLSPPEFCSLLPDLISIVVRFQIIGRGRTGVVERIFGRVCTKIGNGELTTKSDILSVLKELYTSDEEFMTDFANHKETKAVRISYLLSAISKEAGTVDTEIQELMSQVSVRPNIVAECLPEGQYDKDQLGQIQLIGNYNLLNRNNEKNISALENIYNKASEEQDPFTLIQLRSQELAQIAKEVWRVSFEEASHG